MNYSSTRWLVGKNTVAQIVGKIIGAGVTFLITLMIAQKLGVAGYGDFTKVTTYVAFFYLFCDFGLNAVFLQKSASWHSLVLLRCILSTLLVACALFVLPFLPQNDFGGYTMMVKAGIILFSPTIIFQSILTSANAIFQKNFRYDLSTVATAAGSFVSLFFIFAVTRQNTSLLPVLTGLLVGSVFTAAIALFFAIKIHASWVFSFDTKQMKNLLISAIPLAATLIFNLIYFHVDAIILTISRPTTDVGIYGLAYKFFEFPLVVPTFFMNSLYPLLLREISNRKKAIGENYFRLILKSFVFLLIASFLFLVTIWVAAPLLSFIKPEFTQSVIPLRILSLGLPFFFLSSLTMWTLISLSKQAVLAGIYAGAMMVNIILNVLFIPSYGYIAASWITVLSEAMVLALSGAILVKSLYEYNHSH